MENTYLESLTHQGYGINVYVTEYGVYRVRSKFTEMCGRLKNPLIEKHLKLIDEILEPIDSYTKLSEMIEKHASKVTFSTPKDGLELVYDEVIIDEEILEILVENFIKNRI